MVTPSADPRSPIAAAAGPAPAPPPLRLALLRRSASSLSAQHRRILHPLNSSAPSQLPIPSSPFSASSEILIPPAPRPPPTPNARHSATDLPLQGPRIAAMDRSRLSTTPANTTPSETSEADTSSPRSSSATPNIALPMQSPHQSPSPANDNANSTWLADADGGADLDLEGGGGVKLEPLQRRNSARTTTSAASNEWNSKHPCFPHRNPHVPVDSPEYESTRVIRIQRDYMYSGDISPAYSNVYPEILEPYLSETRFREVVKTVNERLLEVHTPWNVWNWIDALVGVFTFWLLEDIIGTYAKRRLRDVERYLRECNREEEKAGGEARFVSLRRTGYMNLDIQIPDPVIELDEEEDDSGDRVDVVKFQGISQGYGSNNDRHTQPPALMINGQSTYS